MRIILFLILNLYSLTTSIGQELVMVRDTVNRFEVGVPIGWRYGVPFNRSVAFMAVREAQNELDFPRENFNINILIRDEVDLDTSYGHFLESIGKTEGFKILEQGEKIVNDRKYKYLIETHKNKISKEDMTDYVLFTNDQGKILILTTVTISENFENFKDLFESIGSSLKF